MDFVAATWLLKSACFEYKHTIRLQQQQQQQHYSLPL